MTISEDRSCCIMTPEQLRSYTYMLNTLKDITAQRTLFNTNARVELVNCFKIANALLSESLMNDHQCALFDRYISSLFLTLQRPHFSKYHPQLMRALHSMEDMARMNLYKKLHNRCGNEFDLFNMDKSTFLERFIARYGGEDHMQRFLAFI